MRTIYRGQAFQQAQRAASRIDAQLYVVSAGLGLVHQDQAIPSYDVSATDGGAGLQAVLRALNAQPSQWWSALSGGGLGQLARSAGDACILIALPAGYLSMVEADLLAMTSPERERLRIFTARPGQERLPPELRAAAMPYDDRLESIPGWAGTRADFAQRALHHFVCEELHTLDAATAGARVFDMLNGLKVRDISPGKSLSDDQVRACIERHWDVFVGRQSQMLAYLRHDLRVACEQGRFRRLCAEVRASRQEAGPTSDTDEVKRASR